MKKLDEPLTDDEASHLLELKTQMMGGQPRVIRLMRRNIRYRLFRIRDGRTEFDNGLRKLVESQLEGRDSIKDFTFTWDVSPSDPLKVINMFEWESEGGKFDRIMELCDDGISREKRVCRPPAFTRQA
jgi:hypothetical protein